MKKIFNSLIFMNFFTVILFYFLFFLISYFATLTKNETILLYVEWAQLLCTAILLPCCLLVVNERLNIKNNRYKFDFNMVLMILSAFLGYVLESLYISYKYPQDPKSQMFSGGVLFANILIITFASLPISYRLSSLQKKVNKEKLH